MPSVKHDLKETESEAAFKFDVRLPYLVFVNENSRNKWGAQRVYRVQLTSHENPLMPEEENRDLVAWVTVGFVHIPHSEDVPNTATACNGAGFFFRPFNFYDEDP
ncbi:unnamed protein product [Lampetra planeri]